MKNGHCFYGWHTLSGFVVMLMLLAGCASSERTAQKNDQEDSFNTITAEDIENSPSSNLHELIEGRVPGVEVFEHAGGIAIRIRGTSSIMGGNEPLYILDGFPTEPGPGNVFQINPHDVKSIKILKGADAATYGVRGANGVIIITTKRGGDR